MIRLEAGEFGHISKESPYLFYDPESLFNSEMREWLSRSTIAHVSPLWFPLARDDRKYGGAEDVYFLVPNLQNYFIRGAATTSSISASAQGANSVTLGTSNLPSHNHGISDPGHTHTVSDPSHSHGVTDPGHLHTYTISDGTYNQQSGIYTLGNFNQAGGTAYDTSTSDTGISIDGAYTGISNQSSATGISNVSSSTGISNQSSGTGISTTSTGSGESFTILPGYYEMNYIIKL